MLREELISILWQERQNKAIIQIQLPTPNPWKRRKCIFFLNSQFILQTWHSLLFMGVYLNQCFIFVFFVTKLILALLWACWGFNPCAHQVRASAAPVCEALNIDYKNTILCANAFLAYWTKVACAHSCVKYFQYQ